ncbi:tyrosine-protein phosphatase [Patulibacter sp. SYSU D01012]|uniref:tyrosine-protein phosphatase n=1 Tax=Patulibacter sp. SYSU D01012 TaxID=2817381 RepID=UPI001B31345A|nr:tyrosine-protein phosphatase [Patulibacter sp. SYSU D01012]
MQAVQRHLRWEGAFNVRDLGGLRTRDGGRTRCGRIVRADGLDGLTAHGWQAALAHGVRTVVDLRNDDEIVRDAAPRPRAITTVHVPLDGIEDREFWDAWSSGPQVGTPLYFRPHLERFPERSARVLTAIARAEPGAVAVHCGSGRDRTGMVALLLLTLAGVEPDEIAADYALSAERLPARYAARGEDDITAVLATFLARRGTTAERVLSETLEGLDVADLLQAHGLAAADVDALRRRLLAP